MTSGSGGTIVDVEEYLKVLAVSSARSLLGGFLGVLRAGRVARRDARDAAGRGMDDDRLGSGRLPPPLRRRDNVSLPFDGVARCSDGVFVVCRLLF